MHPLLLHIDYWAVKMSLTYSTCGFIKICGAASCCCCWRKQLPKTSKTKWILGCAVCFSWGAKNATVFFLIISHKHNFLFDLMEMFCCVVYCMMCIINENQHIKSGSDNKAHFLLVSTWSWQDFFFFFAIARNFLLFMSSHSWNFSKHPVEMCPLDDNTDTNMAAKMCSTLFEGSGLMYSK